MQQLCQRVFCHRQLGPLAHDQTRAYIRHRLKVAGAGDRDIFTDEAIDLIHDRSGGLPATDQSDRRQRDAGRLRAGQKTIDRELVFSCIKDMLGPAPSWKAPPSPRRTHHPSPNRAHRPAPPMPWPVAAYMPPVIALPPATWTRPFEQGSEIAGRLTEINRAAQQAERRAEKRCSHGPKRWPPQ